MGNVKDRLPVSPKLTPSWLLTANGQFVKDEARRNSFLLSQLWKANFVLTCRFLWENLQEQVLRPSLFCWRYTENFWSVESEIHSVWLTTWLRMTTSPLKMQRLLSNFQLKQIRYSFYFTSSVSFLLLSIYHWVLWACLASLRPVSFLIFVILELPHPVPSEQVSPAHLFPALLAPLVMPVSSCRNKQGANCCSVLPAAALSSDKEVTTVAVRVQLATHKPSLLCRASQGKSTSGCCGTDHPPLEEERHKWNIILEVNDCVLSMCTPSLLFKDLYTLSMFVWKIGISCHISGFDSSLDIISKNYFLVFW